VKDRNWPMAVENLANASLICNLTNLERAPFHRPAIAPRQVIVTDRLKPSGSKRLTCMASNVAGTAGDQNLHFSSSLQFIACPYAAHPL